MKRDKMIRELTYMIDESDDVWRKIAFYSDQRVQEILDSLYVRWGNANYEKTPLDYASDEELKELYEKAIHIKEEDKDRAMLDMYRKIALSGEEE
ncbi:MAG: hypothetical protein LM561_06190 [Desulfurococcaceae archaeon]|nr:hypothetical protein [Desulfurococcaceae archaeon]